MSSLKSAVLFSLFSGVSFSDLQRAARQHRASGQAGQQPSARDIAYAARFAAPAQATSLVEAETCDDDIAVVELARSSKAA